MFSLKNKNTRVIVLIMMTLVIVSVFVSKVYYQNVNEAVDPRIVAARKMYVDYNEFAQNNDLHNVLILLDSIELIYNEIPHYKNSFEMGVMANNRAAVFLTLALHYDSINMPDNSKYLLDIEKDSLLKTAIIELRFAIDIYEKWNDDFGNLNKDEAEKLIKKDFFTGIEDYTDEDKNKYLETRLETVLDNKIEIDRRLSVSYTNLGIAFRQQKKYDDAILSYKKAMELWDRNITAENNLNVLLGRPLKKPSVIQKLFPPDKEEI